MRQSVATAAGHAWDRVKFFYILALFHRLTRYDSDIIRHNVG
jgi:hypothetical protein